MGEWGGGGAGDWEFQYIQRVTILSKYNYTSSHPNFLLIKSAMQITQCLHATILVSDLERAEHLYGNIMGLPKVERNLKFPGAWYQIGNFQIHLIVAKSVPSDQVNTEKLGRNRHIAFAVTNLDEAKEQLLSNGCSIQMSASGRSALFTQDPDGNIIEMSEL